MISLIAVQVVFSVKHWQMTSGVKIDEKNIIVIGSIDEIGGKLVTQSMSPHLKSKPSADNKACGISRQSVVAS